MKKAFKIIAVVCAAIFVIGIAMLAVSLFLGGGADSVRSHGNVNGLIENLRTMFPVLNGLFS